MIIESARPVTPSAAETGHSPGPATDAVFAPGHLGELTTFAPFELVDAILDETRTVQRRLRELPSRVGVYFLLAMCLFPEVGYRLVWRKTTSGPTGPAVAMPTAQALRDLRRRAGTAPMRRLFGVLRAPAGPTQDPWSEVRALPHGLLRRLQLPDSSRHRPRPGLARFRRPRWLPPWWS
ncbi:hypothetical protein GCM10010466_25930 [Planomonospora alba]|uniref:Transposase IS4 N-terminal domain-containing protein n=1 Tax=Planomonospora alba TaxID=161354 RepID=A0ABP6N3U6_9ACTN